MKRALLVIDVQNEYFTGRLPVTYPEGSLDRILEVMDASSEEGIPVVVIRHTSPVEGSGVFRKGTEEWKLHPEVAKRRRDLLVDKRLPGSFTGTGLEEWLKNNGVDTVTIAGYMTHMCCDSTAKQAYHRGFAVEFLSDATGTLDVTNQAGSVSAEEMHRAVLVGQAARFSQVITAGEWIRRMRNGSE
ncbi:nicotinamidase-related amidase [Planifilum fimeticola]|uniref:Nicotinamidase-related amidase n=1 Tax=Planifilum fimeticola TaxID=201975 RepID=A0A2T0LCQ2_9BACL|nr:cysteine hydrolase family protein [Planifilum fimeticola]PRX39767.1 nicotinamidase-related amidase [Planifilum fimeticola]